MVADIALHILGGTLLFGAIGFVVYLAHRLAARVERVAAGRAGRNLVRNR